MPTVLFRDTSTITINDICKSPLDDFNLGLHLLDTDILPFHFVGDSYGCPRAKMKVEYEVSLVCRHLNDACQQCFRLLPSFEFLDDLDISLYTILVSAGVGIHLLDVSPDSR